MEKVTLNIHFNIKFLMRQNDWMIIDVHVQVQSVDLWTVNVESTHFLGWSRQGEYTGKENGESSLENCSPCCRPDNH